MKTKLLNNIKNIRGWRTSRKILVISVDDYGNVRLDSKKAREQLDKAGLKIHSRFDAFDTMETREDLELLFETLSSVKDQVGNHAVLSPFALPCNIDFEAIKANDYQKYIYELLPQTFDKLEANDNASYRGTWKLWQEGISIKLMQPQFHGREHLNLKIFNEKLKARDAELMAALKNRSYTSISNDTYKTINYTAAFDFWDPEENKAMQYIIKDGIAQFKSVFKSSPTNFMPPTSNIHESLLSNLKKEGIKYIDTNLIHRQHQGFGTYTKSYNFTGKKLKSGQINIVRNVVFEPTDDRGFDWVNYSLLQIEAAFRWKKPAIISSHRVNFCGHIDVRNRQKGIKALKELLVKVIEKWPDIEFMSANELGDLILKSKGINV